MLDHAYRGAGFRFLPRTVLASASITFRFDICLLAGRVTSKGGWAGVKVAPASEVSERARLAPVAS
jgi:hypothetical protein